MLIVYFVIDGYVNMICDCCVDLLEVFVEGIYRLVYKFGIGILDDESLIVLLFEMYELDICDQVNELIIVSLLVCVLYDEGGCNFEMMVLYDKFVVNLQLEDDEDDFLDDDWDWEDEDDDEDDWDEEDDNDDDVDFDKLIDFCWLVLKNLN